MTIITTTITTKKSKKPVFDDNCSIFDAKKEIIASALSALSLTLSTWT